MNRQKSVGRRIKRGHLIPRVHMEEQIVGWDTDPILGGISARMEEVPVTTLFARSKRGRLIKIA